MRITPQALAFAAGMLAAGFGIVDFARASGNGGQCDGQIVETKINGVWVKTGAICAGLCPPVAPPRQVACDLKYTRYVNHGGTDCDEKVCACIITNTEDPSDVQVQMDLSSSGNPCCDVKSLWEAFSPNGFVDANCAGTCGNGCPPGAGCDTSDPSYITSVTRVRTCACQ